MNNGFGDQRTVRDQASACVMSSHTIKRKLKPRPSYLIAKDSNVKRAALPFVQLQNVGPILN